jgi:hypothetical protein
MHAVVTQVKDCKPSKAGAARTVGTALSGLLVAILPKCPACVAAYLALFTGLGADKIPVQFAWIATLATLAMLTVALVFVARRAWLTKRPRAFALALAGAAAVVGARMWDGPFVVVLLGMLMLVAGSIGVSARSVRRAVRAGGASPHDACC